MKIKSFVKIFISVILLFLIYNLIVWKLYTEKILTTKDNHSTGDLARMSYLSNYSIMKKNYNDLPKSHIMNTTFNYQDIDIITIGDSFSNGMGKGRNPYYQDYLATKGNFSILNLDKLSTSKNFIETIYTLIDSGFITKIGVKYVIIESVQRKIVDRFTMNISNRNKYLAKTQIDSFYQFNTSIIDEKHHINKKYLPDTNFINNGNFKLALYNLLYNFSNNAFFSKVYKVDLKNQLFDHEFGNELLFYSKDLDSIKYNTKKNLEIVNGEFNKLENKLSEIGVKLIFIPVVNKYDLYSSYIKNNQYSQDPFFDLFNTLDKKYVYINTKKIFKKYLEKDIKDIYYFDDMHWSDKASDIISDELLKHIGIEVK